MAPREDQRLRRNLVTRMTCPSSERGITQDEPPMARAANMVGTREMSPAFVRQLRSPAVPGTRGPQAVRSPSLVEAQ
jgi:hypothetical protein